MRNQAKFQQDSGHHEKNVYQIIGNDRGKYYEQRHVDKKRSIL